MSPTFVLVPGAWHTATYYKPLIRALADIGHPSVAVKPRCVDSSPPATSFQPDADAVKDAITELHTDVILVFHSYSGLPVTDAVGDLIANKPGVAGRIKRLVYLAAFVPLKGESLATAMAAAPDPHPTGYYDADAAYLVLRDVATDLLYHDVPEPERSRCAAALGKHPVGASLSSVSYIGYEHIPSTYINATLDRIVKPEYQKWAVERARSHVRERVQAGEAALTEPFTGPLGVFSIETGHSPMVAKPDELAGILKKVAEGE